MDAVDDAPEEGDGAEVPEEELVLNVARREVPQYAADLQNDIDVKNKAQLRTRKASRQNALFYNTRLEAASLCERPSRFITHPRA